MNITEAYRKLELSTGASEDDVKKQFRKLAAKYHPDRNKDPDAEQKSKDISEAYNFIKNYKEPPPVNNNVQYRYYSTNEDFNIADIFENFVNGSFRRVDPNFQKQLIVEIPLTITFAESVLGCVKKISIDRQTKCSVCFGKGFSLSSNCTTCDGKGVTIGHEKVDDREIKVRINCQDCSGIGKSRHNCTECSGIGHKKSKSNLDVRLPGGVITGNKVRLSKQGNYNRYFGNDFHEDAFVNITVTPEYNMTLAGVDVISSIEVSLLDMLAGTMKVVRTVKGEDTLVIPAKSKNKDRISIAGAGVEGTGNHIFILDIKYPEDNMIEKIVNLLTEKKG